MRSYIFTKREAERLLTWIRTGEEDDGTRMLLSRIRKNWPHLSNDMKLYILVMKKLGSLDRREQRLRIKEPRSTSGRGGALLEVYRKARALRDQLKEEEEYGLE